jgi:hypothetical protein
MSYPDSFASEPYRIKFEHRPQYLYARVSGERDSVKISISYWREIAEECRRNAFTKVLVDEDIVQTVSKLEIYQVASAIPKMGFTNVLIAFVDRRLEHQEVNQFGEVVASNRGLRVKVFSDTETAEKWLLES